MANETDTRDLKTSNSKDDGGSTTTVNADSMLHAGMLEPGSKHLDKAHDYHLDQDMGESMEQVNANLHLGGKSDHPEYGLDEEQAVGTLGSQLENSELNSSEQIEAGEQSSEDGGTISVDGSDPVEETAQNNVGGSVNSQSLSGLTGQTENGLAPSTNPPEGTNSSGETRASQIGFEEKEVVPTLNEADPTSPSDLTSVVDNDEAENTVAEDATPGSSTGIQATAIASDGSGVTYSLLDHAGGLFSIDPVTGIVSVSGDLDAETAGTHDIVVQARASDGETQTETFTISVRDVNEYDVSALTTVGTVADTLSEDAVRWFISRHHGFRRRQATYPTRSRIQLMIPGSRSMTPVSSPLQKMPVSTLKPKDP